MAKQNSNQYVLPAVFLIIAVAIVAAVGIGTATGQAAWSTGENKYGESSATWATCSDSDGSQDTDNLGIVAVGGVEYIDACVVRDVNVPEAQWPEIDSSDYQKEYYCERGEASYYITSCECVNGVCLEEQSRY